MRKQENAFEARYQAQGGSRPLHFYIDASDLEDDMSDEDLMSFYLQAVDDDFSNRITPGAEREDQFIAWAREQLNKRKGDAA